MSSLIKRWKEPLIRSKIISGLAKKYPRFLAEMYKYSRMPGAEPIRFSDTFPHLSDRTSKTFVDTHYFYQDLWAFRKIYESKPPFHVDVGSNHVFVGLLTVVVPVHFVEIRPLDVGTVRNLKSVEGSALALPYDDDSVESLSCLHVAEHIGLGRYGDPLDPHGTRKAARELTRCLKPGGNLCFSLPVGKPRLCFNAHRIHAPGQILDYFKELTLVEFSGTNDRGEFIEKIDVRDLENEEYGCGMYLFSKQ